MIATLTGKTATAITNERHLIEKVSKRIKPKSTTSEKPDEAIPVTTYEEMHRYLRGFAGGIIRFLVILGRGDTGKSKSCQMFLNRTIGAGNYSYVEGNCTPIEWYQEAYQFRNLPLVVDDADNILAEKGGKALFKTMCNTDPIKYPQWKSQNRDLKRNDIPQVFETTSPVCYIGNQWPSASSSVDAIASRATMIWFDPPITEMIQYMSTWATDQEIFDFIKEHYPNFSKPGIRCYAQAIEHRELCRVDDLPDHQWKEELLVRFTNMDKEKLIARRLLMDESYGFGYGSDTARIEKFMELTHLTEVTFKRYKREFAVEDMRGYFKATRNLRARGTGLEDFKRVLPLCHDDDCEAEAD